MNIEPTGTGLPISMASIDSPESAPDLDQLPLADQRTYLESDQYQTLLMETFATRARITTLLGKFFLDHPIGRFIVHTQLAPHPIIREKENHERQIRTLADKIKDTAPGQSISDIETRVRLEPQFRPRSPEQISLDHAIARQSDTRRCLKHDYDPNRDIDYRFHFELQDLRDQFAVRVTNLATLAPHFDATLRENKAAFIKTRFYDLLYYSDWSGWLDMIESHANDPEVGPMLENLIFEHREFIYPNAHFRKALFRSLMTILIERGRSTFEHFDRLWQELGVDMSDENELQKLVKVAFPITLLRELRVCNYDQFLGVCNFLREWGIVPEID